MKRWKFLIINKTKKNNSETINSGRNKSCRAKLKNGRELKHPEPELLEYGGERLHFFELYFLSMFKVIVISQNVLNRRTNCEM